MAPACQLPRTNLQDWVARECLHGGGECLGHYCFYWELHPGLQEGRPGGNSSSSNNSSSSGGSPGCINGSPTNSLGGRPSTSAAHVYAAALEEVLCAGAGATAADDAGAAAGTGAGASTTAGAGAAASLSSFYGLVRSWGGLGPAEVRLVSPGSFWEVQELACSGTADHGQDKCPLVLGDATSIELLEGRVVERGTAA
jgi:hypothetical protein